MNNQQLYDNIVKIYPNFSLYHLYLKYKEWDTYMRRHIMNETSKEIYEAIKGLEFCATSYLLDGSIGITIEEEDLHKWEEAIPDWKYDDGVLTITKDHKGFNDVRSALIKIVLDQGNPTIVKPTVVHSYYNSYRYLPQPEGDSMPYNSKYASYIQKIDPNFSIQVLHDNLVKQCEVARTLDTKYLRDLFKVEKDIYDVNHFTGSDVCIDIQDVEETDLFEVEQDDMNHKLYMGIVANLYEGSNTSFLKYKEDLSIEVDTYRENFGF